MNQPILKPAKAAETAEAAIARIIVDLPFRNVLSDPAALDNVREDAGGSESHEYERLRAQMTKLMAVATGQMRVNVSKFSYPPC